MTDPQKYLECYLVGGAVRDELLGGPAGDRDWVVVGSTPEHMEALGFRRVGQDFPVFLHPDTQEEYALARRDRKVAPGYRGFAIDASPTVTLEEDLSRRDLTVNAIARKVDGELIDPWNGAVDIAAGVLRHVSGAFVEDPVRILRVARFAARFSYRNFQIAPETEELMTKMVKCGEVDALVAERVWQELHLALATRTPQVFFEVLRRSGALARILPELDTLFSVPRPKQHQPAGDVGTHALMVLEQAAALSSDTRVRFAALVHDIGKGASLERERPLRVSREQLGVQLVNSLCKRLRVPQGHTELALAVSGHHLLMHKLPELNATTVLKLLQGIDGLRNPEKLNLFILACRAKLEGRGETTHPYPAAILLERYASAIRNLDLTDLETSGLDGKALGQEAKRRRLIVLTEVQETWLSRKTR